MNDWSQLKPEEVLKIALILEKDGKAFYDEAVKMSRDLTGRAMFEYLAGEEVKHLKIFRHELEKLMGSDRATDPDADIEKEVYLFYRRAAETAASDKTRSVLGRLADEEWGHYQMISTILSGLSDTGHWTPHDKVTVSPAPTGGEWSLDEWESSWSINVGALYTCGNCSSMIMVTKGGVGTLAPQCCGRPMVKTSPGGPGEER